MEEIKKNNTPQTTENRKPKLEKKPFSNSRGNNNRRKFRRRPSNHDQYPDMIFEVIKIKKITKVVKGGRRYRFSVLMVGGDKKGKVGYGTGKALEVPDAIKKAKKEIIKHQITVPLTKETQTIAHEIIGQKGASKVLLKPAIEGTGVVAGGSIRTFLELAGVRNIYSKSFGARSNLNMILATIDGIENLRTKQQVATARNKKVGDILKPRETKI